MKCLALKLLALHPEESFVSFHSSFPARALKNHRESRFPKMLLKLPIAPFKHWRTPVLGLEGGAAKYAFQGGVLRQFETFHFFPFKVIYAISAGCLTGGAYVSGQLHRLGEVIRDTSGSKFIARRNIIFQPFSDDYPLIYNERIVRALFGKGILDAHKLTQFDLRIGVLDMETAQVTYLSTLGKTPAELVEIFIAAIALPGFKERPGIIGNRDYIDAGIVDPLPFDAALKARFVPEQILTIRSHDIHDFNSKLSDYVTKMISKRYRNHMRVQWAIDEMAENYLRHTRQLYLDADAGRTSVIAPPQAIEKMSGTSSILPVIDNRLAVQRRYAKIGGQTGNEFLYQIEHPEFMQALEEEEQRQREREAFGHVYSLTPERAYAP